MTAIIVMASLPFQTDGLSLPFNSKILKNADSRFAACSLLPSGVLPRRECLRDELSGVSDFPAFIQAKPQFG
jgi:hypothetical protein